jgi:8-oxo-dGTP pyrophosphatase MutT (NUDIX family)
MTRSATALITDGHRFLTAIPHGKFKKFRDLPKGRIEENETPIEAVIREVKEETGLNLEKDKLDDLGVWPYNKSKDIHVFLYEVERLPDLSRLRCSSMILGTKKPEMTGFEYLTLHEMSKKLYPKLWLAIEDLLEAE